MDIRVDVSDVQALARKLSGVEPIVRSEMVTAMERSTLAVEGGAKRLVRTDTHHLQRAITRRVEQLGTAVRGIVGANPPHAAPNEFGRSAGSAMPPKGALLGWMRRHGIDEKAEFVVRRAIGRRGIPPQSYLRRSLAEQAGAIQAEFAQVAARVVARIGL